MSTKGIEKYLPKKEKLSAIQVYVPDNLKKTAEKIKKDIKWNELIEALLKRYIEESK